MRGFQKLSEAVAHICMFSVYLYLCYMFVCCIFMYVPVYMYVTSDLRENCTCTSMIIICCARPDQSGS